MPEESGFVDTLVEFARELRAAGLTIGPGDVVGYCSAVAVLDPSDLLDLYWAGRTALVTRYDQVPEYDRVFHRFFLGEPGDDDEPSPFTVKSREEATAVLQVPETEQGQGQENQEREAQLGLMASSAATVKNKAFGACTPEELTALRRIMAAYRLSPPQRRVRRMRAASSGRRPDLRRTAREALRMHGDPARLLYRERKLRLRPLILVLDVSGSMADYSRHLLQFAYSTHRAATKVEVFCFGTRLTRITRELEHRRIDEAIDRAAKAVFDWEGGTRIGESLEAFVRDWGRRGLARGGIVVICSDGLDRGDPAVLAAAMERLSRLCRRIVWMNPHKGDDADFRPSTLGMMVAAPFVDLLLSGHDLGSLEQLAAALPELR